jgi:hypothetical protein
MIMEDFHTRNPKEARHTALIPEGRHLAVIRCWYFRTPGAAEAKEHYRLLLAMCGREVDEADMPR